VPCHPGEPAPSQQPPTQTPTHNPFGAAPHNGTRLRSSVKRKNPREAQGVTQPGAGLLSHGWSRMLFIACGVMFGFCPSGCCAAHWHMHAAASAEASLIGPCTHRGQGREGLRGSTPSRLHRRPLCPLLMPPSQRCPPHFLCSGKDQGQAEPRATSARYHASSPTTRANTPAPLILPPRAPQVWLAASLPARAFDTCAADIQIFSSHAAPAKTRKGEP